MEQGSILGLVGLQRQLACRQCNVLCMPIAAASVDSLCSGAAVNKAWCGGMVIHVPWTRWRVARVARHTRVQLFRKSTAAPRACRAASDWPLREATAVGSVVGAEPLDGNGVKVTVWFYDSSVLRAKAG